MKKQLIILGISILSFATAMAQNVGINAGGGLTPDPSAGLDVNFDKEGILIPRVDISDLTTAAPVTSPATSLLVYNTNTTTGPGYFYWDGSKWVELFDSNNGKFWKLTGNAASSSNFIGTTNNVDFKIRTNNSQRMVVKANGNIGIGTTAPAEKLHINGSVRGNQSGALRINTGNGYVDIGPKNSSWSHFYTDRPRYWFNTGLTVQGGQIGSYSGNLSLQTSGTTRITALNSNGYVGIGTTSPSAQLHTTGTVRFAHYPSGSNGAIVRTDASGNLAITNFTGNTNQVLLGNGTFGTANTSATAWQLTGNSGTTEGTNFLGTTDNKRLDFRTNNAIRATISSGGYVGIGTTAPATKLHIQTAGAGEAFRITTYGTTLPTVTMGDDNSAPGVGYLSLWLASTPVERVRLTAGNGPSYINAGNVGIGTTAPAAKLHVNGSTRMDGDFYNQQVSFDTDFNSTWTSSSNNTWENTNLSKTITTHGTGLNGSDVFVACSGSFSAWADFFIVRIIRDGTDVIAYQGVDAYTISGNGNTWIFSLSGVDSPSAGSHTYTVQVNVSDSGSSNTMNEGTLSVMEIKK